MNEIINMKKLSISLLLLFNLITTILCYSYFPASFFSNSRPLPSTRFPISAFNNFWHFNTPQQQQPQYQHRPTFLIRRHVTENIINNIDKNITFLDDDNESNETENDNDSKELRKNFSNGIGMIYDDFKLVCYYGSWAVYRPGRGKFPVEEIDPFLCTHIIYGFAGLSYDNKIRPLDPYNDLKENYGKGAFLRFTGLKKINKNLKTMIAIGGWNEGSVKYSNMAADPEARKVFVRSVMEFLDRYDFDGLDMDWEYPGSRGGKPEDKRNFVSLLRELKQEFEPKGYLLTSAVSAGKHFLDPAYDVPQVSKYLDFINVMCYDYHGGWESKTGHHAPLYGHPNNPDDQFLNVNFSINYWIAKGAPKEKLVLGMGTYGRAFTLRKAEDHDIGSPAPQKGQAGPYTREAGSLGYNEICEFKMKNQNIQTEWDPYYMAPYSYWGRQWVGYDDVKSISIKAQWARAMGLGGGMIWSIETDDFGGHCGDGKYPLLNAIKQVFKSSEPVQLPVPNPEERPSSPTTHRPVSSTIISSTSHQPPMSTTRCTRTTIRSTPPMITSPTVPSTTTRFTTTQWTPRPSSIWPSSTIGSTNRPTSDQSSTSTWWTSSTPWWPQKPASGASPSSEVWWSSTFSTAKNPNSIESVSTTSTTTEKMPEAVKSKEPFVCREPGLFRNPQSCMKFIQCVETEVEGQFRLFFYECPDKTVFNDQTKLCDWVENVPECLDEVPDHFIRGHVQNNHILAARNRNKANKEQMNVPESDSDITTTERNEEDGK